MNEIATMIATIVGAFGGLELIKWFFNRKRVARQDEYRLLRERIDYLNEQMLEKEKRFTEQTERVRELTRQLIDANRELITAETAAGEYKARIASLEAERKMKLCERRGCAQRQPQSGY